MVLTGALWGAVWLASGQIIPPQTYTVQTGDSLRSVAARFSLNEQALTHANPNIEIRPGVKLIIPARFREDGTGARIYTVRNGDTDWSIARRYDLRPGDLHALNPQVRDWSVLPVGSEIKVKGDEVASNRPATTPTSGQTQPPVRVEVRQTPTNPINPPVNSTPATATAAYTVKDGESDWVIAANFNITPSELKALNPGQDLSAIQAGMTIQVPAKPEATPANQVQTSRVRIKGNDVNIRSGPNTSERRLGQVSRGRIANVIDRTNDWYKLQFSGGTIGWVHRDFIEEVAADVLARSADAQALMTLTVAPRDAATGSPNAPQATLAPEPAPVLGQSAADALLATAHAQMGIRYVWGGTSRSGFDCSGFTTYVFARHGVSLPRTALSQSNVGIVVSRDALMPGDLIFFKTSRRARVTHVGISLGGDRFIHASSGGGQVRTDSLNSQYYSNAFVGARRVLGVSASETNYQGYEVSDEWAAANYPGGNHPNTLNLSRSGERGTNSAASAGTVTIPSEPRTAPVPEPAEPRVAPTPAPSTSASTPGEIGGTQTVGADVIGR
ncbi:MAG: C40 family peptidase [Fimbriimonadaceae bacterium]|nr:C40 family peptidase [Fimbriimonadaceae bacterium]